MIVRLLSTIGLILMCSGMMISIASANELEDSQYYQALSLYHNKQWTDAKKAFQLYQQQYPNSKWKYSIILRLADLAGSSAVAIEKYQHVLNQAVGTEWSRDAKWGLASTYFTLGQYEKAIDYLKDLKAGNSIRSEKAIYLTGLSYLALKDFSAAKILFENLCKIKNAIIAQDALAGLGDAHLGLKEYPQALSIYEGYLKDYPEGDFVNHVLKQKSHLLTIQGLQDDALQTMHQLITRYPKSFEAEKIRPKLSKKDADNKYTVQVGAFSKKDYAGKLEKKLRTRGYNAYLLRAGHQDDIFIQVRVGSYTTKAFAEKIGEKLKSKENLPYVIVPYIKPEKE